MTQTLPLDLVFSGFWGFFKSIGLSIQTQFTQSSLADWDKWKQVSGVLWTALKEANCLLLIYVQRDACRTETRPCSLELDLPFRRRAGAIETFHVPALSQSFLLACLRTSAKGILALANPTGNLLRCSLEKAKCPPWCSEYVVMAPESIAEWKSSF